MMQSLKTTSAAKILRFWGWTLLNHTAAYINHYLEVQGREKKKIKPSSLWRRWRAHGLLLLTGR
jgi:hypothetical protein